MPPQAAAVQTILLTSNPCRRLRKRDVSKLHVQLCAAIGLMLIAFVVGVDPVPHTGVGDVDGGGGPVHVPEVGHHLCPDHYQVHRHPLSGLLV